MTTTQTTAKTAEDIRCQIKDIESAAFGMNAPLTAGQVNRIAQLKGQIADRLEADADLLYSALLAPSMREAALRSSAAELRR